MKLQLKYFQNLDHTWSERLHDFDHNLLHSFFQVYTNLGSLHFTALLSLFIAHLGYFTLLIDLLIAVGISAGVTEILKLVFKRKRPENRDQDIVVLQNLSFPSGHSAYAFATSIALMTIPSMSILPVLVATLVAFSRVYLGQHYLSDVLAGATIGTLVSYIVVVM